MSVQVIFTSLVANHASLPRVNAHECRASPRIFNSTLLGREQKNSLETRLRFQLSRQSQVLRTHTSNYSTNQGGTAMTNNTKIDRVSMKQLGLRCYTATRHSALALQTFKRGQGLNLAAKGCQLLKDFFEDYGDPRITDSIASKWKNFLAFLMQQWFLSLWCTTYP